MPTKINSGTAIQGVLRTGVISLYGKWKSTSVVTGDLQTIMRDQSESVGLKSVILEATGVYRMTFDSSVGIKRFLGAPRFIHQTANLAAGVRYPRVIQEVYANDAVNNVSLVSDIANLATGVVGTQVGSAVTFSVGDAVRKIDTTTGLPAGTTYYVIAVSQPASPSVAGSITLSTTLGGVAANLTGVFVVGDRVSTDVAVSDPYIRIVVNNDTGGNSNLPVVVTPNEQYLEYVIDVAINNAY